MEKVLNYVAPVVEVVEVEVEKGFAGSLGGIDEGGQTPGTPGGGFPM